MEIVATALVNLVGKGLSVPISFLVDYPSLVVFVIVIRLIEDIILSVKLSYSTTISER
jgi:hypothetical protein